MKIKNTNIEGLKVITPRVFEDFRGYFFQSYHNLDFINAGIPTKFVQDNISISKHGVLRGLHYQKKDPQAKLVSVLQGFVFDVAVDLRKDSATFGKWFGIELSSENKKQLYIPEGFAHGFLTLSEKAIFMYKCSQYYNPNDNHGILWNDHDIQIDWPNITNIILSEKDTKLPTLVESLNIKIL